MPSVDESKIEEALKDYDQLLHLRELVTRALEEKREAGEVKKSQESCVALTLPESYKEVVERIGYKNLEELFIVSDLEILYDGDEVKVEIKPAKGEKCPRCWNYRDLNANGVCERCAKVLEDLDFKFE